VMKENHSVKPLIKGGPGGSGKGFAQTASRNYGMGKEEEELTTKGKGRKGKKGEV